MERGPFKEFKNIRVLPSGYQVSVTRDQSEFSKHFAGHSPRSLREARKYRDVLLRTLPSKRRRKIPPQVLAACKMAQPVVGVYRNPEKKYYGVTFWDRSGRAHTRSFTWTDRKSEVAAYKAAAKFRYSSLKKPRKK